MLEELEWDYLVNIGRKCLALENERSKKILIQARQSLIIHAKTLIMKTLRVTLLYLGISSFIATSLHSQSDDFDDGNDNGWTKVNTLAGQGVPASWGFPNGNSYSIAMEGHGIEALGPPRAGSFIQDVTYENFYMAVDINFDPSIDQNMGVLARAKEPGLATLDGYGAVYNPRDADPGGRLYILRIDDEAAIVMAEADIEEAVSENLRIVFRGKGRELKTELYTQEDLLKPIAATEVFEAGDFFETGLLGVFSASDDVSVPIDVTFDNYIAAEEEPYRFELIGATIEGNEMTIEFYSKPGIIYSIEESTDLKLWEEIDDSIEGELGDRTSFTVDYLKGESKFFRFKSFGEE